MFGADQMKVNLVCVGCTMIVSAVKMMPDTGTGFVGSSAGGGSCSLSQYRMLEPGKWLRCISFRRERKPNRLDGEHAECETDGRWRITHPPH